MDLSKYADRLKNLKRKRIDLSVKNKNEVIREEKMVSASRKPAVYSMNAEGAEEEIAKDVTEANKLLKYSMLEYEQWQDKVKKNSHRLEGGASFQDLAKSTYDKEVQQLSKIDGNRVNKNTKYRVNNKGKIVVEDDQQLVTGLVETLNKTADERYARIQKKIGRQMNNTTSGGYINEKNKQFNDKLERQTKKRETED